MNCVKCPITDECKAPKMAPDGDYTNKMEPQNRDDCLLVKVLVTVEELKNKAMVAE